MNLNRFLSAMVALILLVVAHRIGGYDLTLGVAFLIVFILPYVWFPDVMGDIVVGRITQKSPESFVALLG
jgi:hypothetical protein